MASPEYAAMRDRLFYDGETCFEEATETTKVFAKVCEIGEREFGIGATPFPGVASRLAPWMPLRCNLSVSTKALLLRPRASCRTRGHAHGETQPALDEQRA